MQNYDGNSNTRTNESLRGLLKYKCSALLPPDIVAKVFPVITASIRCTTIFDTAGVVGRRGLKQVLGDGRSDTGIILPRRERETGPSLYYAGNRTFFESEATWGPDLTSYATP